MNNTIDMEMAEWRGYSAYEVAVHNGFRGTEEEWLAQLHGRDGGVATVNGITHDESGNVALTAANLPVSETDERTMQQVTDDVDKLTKAIQVTDDALDVGSRYIDNARFR